MQILTGNGYGKKHILLLCFSIIHKELGLICKNIQGMISLLAAVDALSHVDGVHELRRQVLVKTL